MAVYVPLVIPREVSERYIGTGRAIRKAEADGHFELAKRMLSSCLAEIERNKRRAAAVVDSER